MYSADGVGRQGHRLLTVSLLFVGSLGFGLLLSQFTATTLYAWIGLGAMGFAIVTLTLTSWQAHGPSTVDGMPMARPVPTPELDPDPDGGAKLLYEYEDTSGPARDDFAGTVPRATVVDHTAPAIPEPHRPQRPAASRADLTDRYTQTTPEVREILTTSGQMAPKRFTARVADPAMHPSHLPPRTMRGKCGGCNTLLLAPTQRPIELACPACNRVTLLE